jgi:hypothetical protein
MMPVEGIMAISSDWVIETALAVQESERLLDRMHASARSLQASIFVSRGLIRNTTKRLQTNHASLPHDLPGGGISGAQPTRKPAPEVWAVLVNTV